MGPSRSKSLSWVLAAAAVGALFGCKKETERQDSPPATSAPPSQSAPRSTIATAVSSSSAQPVASTDPASVPAVPSARCSAKTIDATLFIGRTMRFLGEKAERDRLGLLVAGTTTKKKRQLRRLAIDPPAELALADTPVNPVLVEDAEAYLLGPENIYYIAEQSSVFPFNGRLYYLPAGVEPLPAPKVLLQEAIALLGEWDGWLYALRLRDFNRSGLAEGQVEILLHPDSERWNSPSGTTSGYGWRFAYDLVRVRPDGTSKTVGVFPRSVDAYHQGYVYGRTYLKDERELRIFRAPVDGGATETLYSRKQGYGRGGVADHLSALAVDRDGVFFYNADQGVVCRIPHAGGPCEVLVGDLAFGNWVETYGDLIFVGSDWGFLYPHQKDGGKPVTWKNERDSLFGRDKWGCSDYWSGTRVENFQFVAGRRTTDGRATWFAYKYLPGGIADAVQLPVRPGHVWMNVLAADADCIYYTRSDWYSSWFYAMPRPL